MDEMQVIFKSERMSYFKKWWLEELMEFYEVFERSNGSFTFETKEFGIIDYFPKSNSLLIRKSNDWKRPGLQFIKDKLLK